MLRYRTPRLIAFLLCPPKTALIEPFVKEDVSQRSLPKTFGYHLFRLSNPRSSAVR
jgi:hypothetical protein